MTTTTFEADVLRLIDLQQTIKDAETEVEAIRERIRAHGSGQVGDLRVSVTPQRRFSVQLAATTLSAEQIVAISETTLSGTKAKAVLPPVIYESLLYEIGVPRVTVR